jgi:hypothetical protein
MSESQSQRLKKRFFFFGPVFAGLFKLAIKIKIKYYVNSNGLFGVH